MDHSHQNSQLSHTMGSVPLQPSNRYTSSNGRPLGYASRRPSQVLIQPLPKSSTLCQVPEEPQIDLGRRAIAAKGSSISINKMYSEMEQKYGRLSSREAKQYDQFSPEFAPRINPLILEQTNSFPPKTDVSKLVVPASPRDTRARPVREKKEEARLYNQDEGRLKAIYTSDIRPKPLPVPALRPRASAPDLGGSRQASMGGQHNFQSGGLRSFQAIIDDAIEEEIQTGRPRYNPPSSYHQCRLNCRERSHHSRAPKRTALVQSPGISPTEPLPPPPQFKRRPSHNIDLTLPDSPRKLNLETPYPPFVGPQALFPTPQKFPNTQETIEPTPRYGDDEMENERMVLAWRPKRCAKDSRPIEDFAPAEEPIPEAPSLCQQFAESAESTKGLPVGPFELEGSQIVIPTLVPVLKKKKSFWGKQSEPEPIVAIPVLKKEKSFWGGVFGRDKDTSKRKLRREIEAGKGEKERGRTKERVMSDQEEWEQIRKEQIENAKKEQTVKARTEQVNDVRHIPIKVGECNNYGIFARQE